MRVCVWRLTFSKCSLRIIGDKAGRLRRLSVHRFDSLLFDCFFFFHLNFHIHFLAAQITIYLQQNAQSAASSTLHDVGMKISIQFEFHAHTL